ncbi:TPA: protein translocase subunit SecF [candidate division CPR2 bacterium]|uniref:Protein-export membrane protein SecF n=1 Tax=candidate division CPR2 bacterium GW2011_GWC1_41_48 TaxID=1618344 RepID=A0A0G0Z9E6_UNCC2|nr:MAG: Protein translocase subunit SecF [candidate division CPR2 bacterium GW2011_GWC2_39_35]KKR29488.1 MAG: Protein translocase subunit SecF [candidate division CPR2 bacterium GW2011_GWD2_39_7]KKR29713.1 MAG: Protein translocase subunit SecF [candidate division CPR2 bacterium GW2011_GWD1_39_7]KKS09643.1 MAG: Protein translocase subunit SecF [candidate division CPR2 bacterium GW2011_GWC1_41_48]HBG81438.1 protein translocase subunit SecF [candidate division CPR2 bacterium]
MNIMGKRKFLYILSLAIIIPGIIALLLWGLKLSIDFTGGTLLEIAGTQDVNAVKVIADENKFENTIITTSGDLVVLKAKEIPDATHRKFIEDLKVKIPGATENRFESVGPTMSKTITKNAFYSVGLASIFIVIYLAYAFKKVSKPLSPWEFGIMAVVALIHDALVVVGVFAIFGHFLHIEIDSMFITAILTIIGFSVHDTIVVYDRIREKALKEGVDNFESLVNRSILETFSRSINTSMTVIMTLLVIYLFGGATIKHFILALLIGITAGTYSSIFVASALLVESFNLKQKLRGRAKWKQKTA